MGNFDYNYFGVPIRAGYVIGKVLSKEAVVPYAAAEAFVQADGNLATAYGMLLGDSEFSPSPWHAGVRLNYYIAYVEATMSMSSMHSSERSLGLEVGLGF